MEVVMGASLSYQLITVNYRVNWEEIELLPIIIPNRTTHWDRNKNERSLNRFTIKLLNFNQIFKKKLIFIILNLLY
jgi:hypothetical protein